MKILTHEEIDIAIQKMARQIEICHGNCINIYPVPRGGIPIAYHLLRYLPNSSIVDSRDEADIIIDDLVDSGKTRQKFDSLPFYTAFDKQKNPELGWLVFPWEGSGESSIEDACVRLLEYCGENPEREGLKETPARMARAWQFWTSGYNQNPKDIFKTFEDGGENYDEMIVISPIPFYSHCEHHMAAIFGDVYIAYIPNGRIAGLSKFARLVDVFARRLQVQERLTTQIADTIEQELNPRGIGVFIKARHFCMESRGVQKSGVYTKTSALRGIFLTKAEVRAEFFGMIDK
ncbi:MAG: GTP cyclohydrolase 1 [candidate division WS6 bacterium GW2011_GWF1_35_23]|uniref:GTP cyclohydrolase 1 n=1 Tax=candidate division WS6 bacterium GW2011_GWF1_35_23 TaxID=1619097 RepID=A0A0G0ERC0_9BACT|nr:MAG: GTP cyclohydrolase 1 [candidate division WS6 bacterium GW2011_GWF1_35_23]